tara:strand:- start:73283 stop:73774 length:492 start_codon:yes stop_codon:yes gene_type:complete
MKISRIVVLIATMAFTASCSLPSYVPNAVDAAVSVHGGFIKVTLLNGRKIEGELLSSNNERITVMMEGFNYPTQIKTSGIMQYKLQFAKGLNSKVTLNMLLPLSHGVFAIVTLPFNALVLGAVLVESNKDYKIYSDETTYEELSKYARYPQGLPPVYKMHALD